MTLSARERVRRAFEHEPPDRSPWQVELTSSAAQALADAIGQPIDTLDAWAGNHVCKLSLTGGSASPEGDEFVDDFGVAWDRSGLDRDIGVIRRPLLAEPDLSGFALPAIDAAALRRRLCEGLAGVGDRFVFAKLGTTLFERAWSFCGLEAFLVHMAAEPDFAHELLGRIGDWNARALAVALETAVDGVYLGDDYGQQGGLLMSPAMWRAFIKPHLAACIAQAHAAGKVVALHSCGNILAILDDLVEIGLDAYQTVQPEVYDLGELKARWGDRLVFWGGLSTQRDLPNLDPDGVRRLVRETDAVLGRGGGYIAGPTHRIPPDVPPANIVALIEALRGAEGARGY